MPTPPKAPKRLHLITQHGRTRQDDYYWLRERYDPQTIAYLEAENDYLKAVLAHTNDFRDTLYREMKARIPERDVSAPFQRGDFNYYNRMEPGKEYPIYCRKPVNADNSEEILLDLNLLADGHPFCGLGAFEVSPDHTLLAYLLDTEGSETYTLYIQNLLTGELLPDTIPNTNGYLRARIGLAWANDQKCLYYTTQMMPIALTAYTGIRWAQIHPRMNLSTRKLTPPTACTSLLATQKPTCGFSLTPPAVSNTASYH
jgi:oligopeptidase B